MGAKKRPLWRAVALTAAALAGAGMLAVAPAAPAHADPECVNGAYMLWVRGSGQTIGDVEAARFRQHVTYALNAAGIGSYAWAELGNLDNNRGPGERPDSPNEYPAVPVDNWHAINVVTSAYANSVTIGVNEFIAHLNDRYAGDGPTGKGRCSREVLVIGAYSQGANVVGDALQRQGYGSLSQAARNHIGFFASYGDPKSNRLASQCPPSAKANAPCGNGNNAGMLYGRNVIFPSAWSGSWCDQYDGVCNRAAALPGSHTSTYRDWWIWQSAAEIAGKVKNAVQRMAAGLPANNLASAVATSSNPAYYTTTDTDHDGIKDTGDHCPSVFGLPLYNGCPPPRNRNDLAWYDGATLWGFKGPSLGTAASKLGFGRPDWAGAGDYNRDGREDLFWYHESSTTIYVILGGDFTRVVVARGPGIGRPVWASTGDFDGNGFRDEIAWHDGRMLFLLRGEGLGTAYATTGYSPPDWAGVGDVTQDGRDDLFWYHGGVNGTIYGIPSTGSGFAGAYAIRGPGIGTPQWAGVGDFDGNGKRNDLAWYSGGVLFTFTGPGLPTTGVRHGYAMNDWAGVGKCDSSGRDSLFWYHGGSNGTVYCVHNNGQQFTDTSVVRGPGVGQPVWAATGDIYP